jgi:probable F420-dependent oxidoreductase
MANTIDMKYGPLVTNPGVREWSVAASLFANLCLQSGNRFEIGLGRGDSSRRMLGKKPMTIANMVEFTHAVKGMVRGDNVQYQGTEAQLPWSNGYEIPVWIAAYGPKALQAAGEAGDGLVIQLADVDLVKYFSSQAIAGGTAAGRDMSNYKIMSAAPVWVGDMEKSLEQTRWFPAMVGNHVADIVEKYGMDSPDIPQHFTAYIEGRKGYDYHEHADKDAEHLDFITEETVEAFGILGPVEKHVEKLKELEASGVSQFNIYLMCGEEERIVAEYAEHVIPHFQ